MGERESGCSSLDPAGWGRESDAGYRLLPGERLQRRPVPHRPPVTERIAETALAMNSPRRRVIRRGFYRRRARFGSAIDEAARLIDKDLDPRGGQPNVGRAGLRIAARHRLVNEERGAVEMESGNSAQVSEFARVECRFVPADRRSSVGNDQHHRN